MACPGNLILYNGSLCACPPGYLLNRTANSCARLLWSSNIRTDSGVDTYQVSFPETIFSFDTIKKFTQSQAVFLEATLVMLLSWLAFCSLLRFTKLGDGRSIWFRIRWWISRLDVCFATRHWLDDQKLVAKRKTELGGAFSIASLILFTGLFAALLYQIIAKRTIEVHNVKAANAPDLAAFSNDMEFNVTTISSMSCSNLRAPSTLVSGSSRFINRQVAPLSNFLSYSCHNTSLGPLLSFRCNSCQLIRDFVSISWQFIDLPNNPATAVGFGFNLTAESRARRKHVSFVSGVVRNGSAFDDRPVTFRGPNTNILVFNLFPRIYHNLHDLRLIQPLFHEFVPGSSVRDTSQLQASLQSSNDGLINTTLYINYLSTYIIEIENENIMGPVGFLADLGGLYCISVGLFFFLMLQFEYRIKKLRNEDSVIRKIRNRWKAQERWDKVISCFPFVFSFFSDVEFAAVHLQTWIYRLIYSASVEKLRKYVMYTWGCNTLDDDQDNSRKKSSCASFMDPSSQIYGSNCGSVSLRNKRRQNQTDSIRFNKRVSLPSKKEEAPRTTYSKRKRFVASHDAVSSQHEAVGLPLGDGSTPPVPPLLELKLDPVTEMLEIQENSKRLYD